MRTTIVTTTVRPGLVLAGGLLLLAALAGCSGGSEEPDGPREPTAVPTSADNGGGPGGGGGTDTSPTPLPTGDWEAGLEALPDEAAVAACQQPHTASCAELVAQVGDGLDTLAADLEAAGGADTYPKTVEELETAAEAREAYDDAGCGTTAATLPEADCMSEALAVATGVTKAELMLSAETAGD